jgi:hypothetical protein
MKDPSKLQRNLIEISHQNSLHLQLPLNRNWNEFEFEDAAFVVQDYLNQRGGNEDLEEWLDQYRFFAETK